MADSDDDRNPTGGVTRRDFIRGVGAAGVGLAATPLLGNDPKPAMPHLWFQSDAAAAGNPEQLHIQFGGDASREIAVSWATPGPARNPVLQLGSREQGHGTTVRAETRTYIDAKSGTEVHTQHALLHGLDPATDYVYQVSHDGATAPLGGRFTTAPGGRAKFRFTSFGDQATPEPGNGLASVWAGFNPPQVERLQPLFHLLNGDLCYANISPDRVKAWHDFFQENQVSAANRPWMPAAGNHEDELGNGPIGYGSYRTRFSLPGNGEPAEFQGLWYTFRAGSVRVISLNNDDVCLQDGGDNYVNGYSGGRQKRWLERTLAAARREEGVDWVVVVMHQVAMSSVHDFNGADLGIRREWLPLFDRYGVDLVVAGHEHHYERMKAVRGVDPASATMRPQPVSDALDVIDTSRGTVHMIIGGGGRRRPPTGSSTIRPGAT